ncbi:uncharacterized protein [Onthophagus taurus]|uniref:uncharacterized protein n=1 Tax=Onthophagus taurus TaxID=166361 RepID=UPI0039BDFBB9
MARKLLLRGNPSAGNQVNGNNSSTIPPVINLNPFQKQQLLNSLHPNLDEIDEQLYEYYQSPNFGDFLMNPDDFNFNLDEQQDVAMYAEAQLDDNEMELDDIPTGSIINNLDEYNMSEYQEEVLNSSSIYSNADEMDEEQEYVDTDAMIPTGIQSYSDHIQKQQKEKIEFQAEIEDKFDTKSTSHSLQAEQFCGIHFMAQKNSIATNGQIASCVELQQGTTSNQKENAQLSISPQSECTLNDKELPLSEKLDSFRKELGDFFESLSLEILLTGFGKPNITAHLSTPSSKESLETCTPSTSATPKQEKDKGCEKRGE